MSQDSGLIMEDTLNLEPPRSGWELGSLVAHNVGSFQGIRTDLGASSGKLGINAFASIAKLGHKTVTKYLDAWNLAAEDGLVPHSSSLTPGSVVELDERHTGEVWNLYYSGSSEPQTYLIGHLGRPDLPVKIGKANCVKGRLSTLQTGHYTDLELLLTLPGGYEVERELHNRFADKRVRGEWFNLTSDDLEWVRENYG